MKWKVNLLLITFILAFSAFGALPVAFEKNQGQWNREILYAAKSRGTFFLVTQNALVLSSAKGREQILVEFPGGEIRKIAGQKTMPYRSNYFLGKEKFTDVKSYRTLRILNLYPGVDLLLKIKGKNLIWDWYLSPGSDPEALKFRIKAGKVKSEGNKIIAQSGKLKLILDFPFSYQIKGGKRIPAKVKLNFSEGVFSFSCENCRRSLPLVIDPLSIFYASYAGGSSYDYAYGVHCDERGYIYLTGWTISPDFPTTPSSIQPSSAGQWESFVMKMEPDGKTPVFITYLGGSFYDLGYDVGTDEAGNVYVVGATWSTDFPTVAPFQSSLAGYYDAFLTVLNPSGNSILFSTFWGGNDWDWIYSMDVSPSGTVAVIGVTRSSNFPTVFPVQSSPGGADDAFVAKFIPLAGTVVFSTYLGGSGDDWGYGAKLAPDGSVVVDGWTESTDFPTFLPLQISFGGGLKDVFFTKIAPDGSHLIFSSFLGGTGKDEAYDLNLDLAGNIYITGSTTSPDFPIKEAFQNSLKGTQDAFLTKVSSDGSHLVYSTYIGGSEWDDAEEVEVNSLMEPTIVGGTSSSDFPLKGALRSYSGGKDLFVLRLSSSGKEVVFSTLYGGSGDEVGYALSENPVGDLCASGGTNSTDFPVLNPFQSSSGGNYDAIYLKISFNYPPVAVIKAAKEACSQTGFVLLDGSPSFDRDGRVIRYIWKIEEKPSGSRAYIKGTGAKVHLFVDKAGLYKISLQVVDNRGEYSKKTYAKIWVKNPSLPRTDLKIERKRERAWIIKKDFVEGELRVYPGDCVLSMEKYAVYRKERGGEWEKILEVFPSSMEEGNGFLYYPFMDKYLDPGVTYFYRIGAFHEGKIYYYEPRVLPPLGE